MELSERELFFVIAALLLFIAGGCGCIVIFKLRFRRRQVMQRRLLNGLLHGFTPEANRMLDNTVTGSPKAALRLLVELSQNHKLHLDSRNQLIDIIRRTSVETYYHRRLRSVFRRKRMDAAIHLSALPCTNTHQALRQALRRENSLPVKLHLCSALAATDDRESFAEIVATLPNAPQWYRTRINMILASFGRDFHQHVIESKLLERNELEIQSLLIDFAAQYPSAELKQYLLQKTQAPQPDIAYRACRNLGVHYPQELLQHDFLCHVDPVIRNIALQAAERWPTWHTVEEILPLLTESRNQSAAAAAIARILQKEPRYFTELERLFCKEEDPAVLDGLAQVFSNRIEYLLTHMLLAHDEQAPKLLEKTILRGKVSGMIGFLNKNRNIELENAVLTFLRPLLPRFSASTLHELRLYLDQRILAKLGEEPILPSPPEPTPSLEKNKLLHLRLLLPAAFLTVPAVYLFRYREYLETWDLPTHLLQFVLDFNYYIAYYSLAVNGSYLLLLVFSLLALNRQSHYWRLKKMAFLFRPRVLPSISVIAPAFREQETIVESVRSLLSLHYPNYEVIVVNDGSTDETLHRLIEAFELERIDRFVPPRLKTKPIRGVYISKKHPRLFVVDKANGGKADALNVGICLSQKEYYCGIDADSLLEKDSLTKLAAMIVDAPGEPIAIGGNIFPVNGCRVDKGSLDSVNIPASHLARFQTIEYLRAFMAGRLGWSHLRSLLIISGAFGLFSKDRVVEIGGYLTSSERHRKDTVGEDMELVVRLTRHMHSNRLPHSVLYCYNANCWTEVPESLPMLYRQRDRWQRGLIDILYFHKQMQLNPRYGRIGLLAMPYYFLFETYGPFIEFQGYLMVAAAALLGLLNMQIALLLFISSILLGILVSVFSLVIIEKDNNYFPGPYMTTILLYAVLENFGVRQIISFWRVTGYFSALRRASSWGKMTRQGFQKKMEAQPSA